MADTTPRITLRIFQIELRKARTTDGFEPLSRFGQNHDLFTFLQETIPNWGNGENQRIVNDRVNKKIMRRQENGLSIATRRIYGFVESGEYGTEGDIVDTDSGEQKYRKQKKDAEVTPFYFQIYVPENRYYGLLVIQSYKNRGIQTLLCSAISHGFRERFPEHILDFKPLASKELAEKFMNEGMLGKVTFRDTNSLSNFNPFEMDGTEFDRADYDIEVRIIPKRNDNLMRTILRRVRLDQEQKLEPVLRIEDFKPTSTEVTMKLNGRDRTIELDRLEELGSFFDITSEVSFDPATEFPTLESVHREAQSILDGIVEQIEESGGIR